MNKKLLVVEYDGPTVDDLRALFPESSFLMDIAEDGMAAREFLKKNRYDLVITAAMLPKFHGFNLSQLISKEYPETKVIIISGVYKGVEYKKQAVNQYGATDFFTKPIPKEPFKKRAYELMDVDPGQVEEEGEVSQTRMPDTSTKKIHKPGFEKQPRGLSSEEIFGDIIQEVEGADTGDKAPAASPSTRSRKDRRDPRKAIEEEISRKFEETLSGLGLTGKIDRKTPPPSDKKSGEVREKASSEDKRAEEPKSPPPRSTEKPAPEETAPKPSAVKPEKKEQKTPEKKPEETRKEVYGYDILGLIARGGMAELYKARKHGVKGFEKIIALKKILAGYGEDDKFIEMFVDEAKIAAELTHPNIVQIYDLGKEENNYFIAMEYVEGTDLRMLLRKYKEQDRLLPEEISLYIVTKILNALEYAHSAKNNRGTSLNIVHRDISPPNILLSFSGEVKLTDFGVSKASIKMHQTVSGSLKGKLLYMSPEQSRGDQSVDARADIFAAGIILYELLTGVKPFLAASEMGVLKKLQEVDCPAPREIKEDIDPRLEKIVVKALQKDKEKRYQTAEEMIKDLESYIEDSFNIAPNFTHLAYLLGNVFEAEIKQRDIKLKQKFKPKPIEKKESPPSPVAEEVEEKPVSKEKEGEDATARKEKELLLLQEEFEPAVEIDLEKKKEEADARSDDREPVIDSEIYDELAREERKGRKGLWLTLVLGAVVIVGGYFVYTNYIAGTGESRPVAGTVEKEDPPADMSQVLDLPDNESGEDTQLTQDIKQFTDESGDESTSGDGGQDTTLTPGKTTDPVDDPSPDIPVKTETVKESSPPENESRRNSQRMVEETRPRSDNKPVETGKKQEVVEEPGETQLMAEETENKATEPVQSAEQKQKPEPRPQPVVKEGMVIPLDQVNVRPLLIEKVLPEIKAKHKRELKYNQEVVEVRFLVDHRGRVERVQLQQGSSSLEINLMVTSAVKNWRYQPAIKNNKKVKVWLTEKFKINKN